MKRGEVSSGSWVLVRLGSQRGPASGGPPADPCEGRGRPDLRHPSISCAAPHVGLFIRCPPLVAQISRPCTYHLTEDPGRRPLWEQHSESQGAGPGPRRGPAVLDPSRETLTQLPVHPRETLDKNLSWSSAPPGDALRSPAQPRARRGGNGCLSERKQARKLQIDPRKRRSRARRLRPS